MIRNYNSLNGIVICSSSIGVCYLVAIWRCVLAYLVMVYAAAVFVGPAVVGSAKSVASVTRMRMQHDIDTNGGD